MNDDLLSSRNNLKMTYKEVKIRCHVRSAIYRAGDEWTTLTQADIDNKHPALRDQYEVGQVVRKLYWKNHPSPLDDRVSAIDQEATDWEEYDPREQPECSAYNEVPA